MQNQHNYITYFDKNYLTKGLALIESLRKHDPSCAISVVCLDEETQAILLRLSIPYVRPVPLSIIEKQDTDLLNIKGIRSRVEYYWSMTPCIISLFLNALPEGQVLTYVDADMLFWSSTEPLFEELGTASVLIHGHNFPVAYKRLEAYGLYNVGLMCFRNDAEGRKVLAWWRRKCLEWCGSRIEADPDGGTRYGDQKYLERFVDISAAVRVCQHIGAGVAPWNQIQYTLESGAGAVPLINGKPIIFYHYHSFIQLAPRCAVPSTHEVYQYTQQWLELTVIPYIEVLHRALELARSVEPAFTAGFTTEVPSHDVNIVVHKDMSELFQTAGFTNAVYLKSPSQAYLLFPSPQLREYKNICEEVCRSGRIVWRGNYPDWASAVLASGGYDTGDIFLRVCKAACAVRDGEALWERDSVLFYEAKYNWPLLAGLYFVANRQQEGLHVLDYGGALGSTYMQHAAMLRHITPLTWNIIEQEHVVKYGYENFSIPPFSFFESIPEAFSAVSITCILLSGVLQYMEDSYALLKKCAKRQVPIIIDRTPMWENDDRITVQTVPPEIYAASYPCHWLDKRRIEGILTQYGYTLSPWFQSAVDPQGFLGTIAILR